MRSGTARVNYMEPCTCGYILEEVQREQIYRIVSWKCPKCGRYLAGTMLSDSPVTGFYVLKTLYKRTNARLREEKGLPPRKTIVTFWDKKGNMIPWKDVEEENKRWEKRIGTVQRKAF